MNGSGLPAGWRLWLGFATAAIAPFVINIDVNIVNVALPLISRQFAVPVSILQWVPGAYLLMITAVVPAITRLAERGGRRLVFGLGSLAFAGGSAACAVAPSFAVLVAARAFQGIGAAALMSTVNAVVALLFPPGFRGRALGMAGAVVAAGSLVGPGLGGLLAGLFGWRAVFWINVPLGLAGAIGTWQFLRGLPDVRPGGRLSMDGWGAWWFAAFAAGWEGALVLSPRLGGLLLLLVAALSLFAFIRRERGCADPVVPLRLFRQANFTRALMAGLTYYWLMMFPGFLIPLYLEQARGLPVGLAGLLLMTQAAAMVACAPLGGWMADRWGTRLPARLGLSTLVAACVGFGLLGRADPLWVVVAELAAMGLGSGLYNAAGNTMVLNSVAPADLGLASGLGSIQRAMGRAMGIAGATLAMSLTWTLVGIGPVLALGHARYGHWLIVGMHGAFGLAAVTGLLGWWAVPRLPRPAPPEASATSA